MNTIGPQHDKQKKYPLAKSNLNFGAAQEAMTFNARLGKALKTMGEQLDARVPEFGLFPVHTITVENAAPKPGEPGKVELSFGPFQNQQVKAFRNMRYLQVKVSTPGGKSHSTGRLYSGTKQQLAEALASPDAPAELRALVAQAMESMKQDGLS